MIGNKNHGTLPVRHSVQGVDKTVKKIVCIANRIVIGINQHAYILFTLFHVHCHRLVHLEFLGVFIGILWPVAGACVQDDEHFVLLA